jgi:hypothetical protein
MLLVPLISSENETTCRHDIPITIRMASPKEYLRYRFVSIYRPESLHDLAKIATSIHPRAPSLTDMPTLQTIRG